MEKAMIIQKEKRMVNAVLKLTLDEQRLLNYSIAKVDPFKYVNGRIYFIEIKKIGEFFGVDQKHIYTQFTEALDRLYNRQVTYFCEIIKKYVTCRIITDKVTDNAGIIGLQFSRQMGEMISSDSDYLSYKLAQTIGISSPNANRIYEILLHSLKRCPVGKLTKKFKVAELKKMLGLEEKYKLFFNFEKKVLSISKTQINKHTDIRINYEIIKMGRTPTHIKFTAQFKKGQEPEAVEYQEELPDMDREETRPITDEQRQKIKLKLDQLMKEAAKKQSSKN